METEFGSAIVHFGESAEGYLICHAENQYGQSVWAASRTTSVAFSAALSHAIMDDGAYVEAGTHGLSIHGEAAAVRAIRKAEQREQWVRNEEAGLCHCGHSLYGSDHCPLCGCEQYEAYCDVNYYDSPIGRAQCDCPYHS